MRLAYLAIGAAVWCGAATFVTVVWSVVVGRFKRKADKNLLAGRESAKLPPQPRSSETVDRNCVAFAHSQRPPAER